MTMTPTPTKEWTLRTVRHPHGPTSRLWVSADGRRYKVFETGPDHPMNRLVVDDAATTDGGRA